MIRVVLGSQVVACEAEVAVLRFRMHHDTDQEMFVLCCTSCRCL